MVTTQDVLAVVARSPHNWGSGRHAWLAEEMGKLGAPAAELAAVAVAALDAADRNERVRAVWALGVVDHPTATDGILRALRDPARRVREVAMKSAAPHHVTSTAVVEELRRIAEDEEEIRGLRSDAFFVLSSLRTRDALPEVAGEALRELMGSDRFRASILRRLCSWRGHRPDAATRELLQEFVRTGTKDEAVMATRALCGQVLVSVNRFLSAEQRQRLREQYDPGPGTDYAETRWLPVEDAAELARSVGVDVH
jgi:hypothetical protein